MRVSLCVVMLVFLGCERMALQPERPVFSDQQLLGSSNNSPPRRLSLGELCRPGVSSDCASGVCLLTAAHPGAEHDAYCSMGCRDEDDCPPEWLCRGVLPGPDGRLCAPPDGWKPHAVVAGRRP